VTIYSQRLGAEPLIALGSRLLQARRFADAEATYRVALQLEPSAAAAHANLGTALKRLDRLDEAITCYRTATRLLRSVPVDPAAVIEPAQAETFQWASPLKLAHDAEQIAYLIEHRRRPAADRAMIATLDEVRRAIDDGVNPSHSRALSAAQAERLAHFYNRLLHHPAIDIEGSCLNPALDRADIEARYAASAPSIVVVDDLLSLPALEAIHRFCLEATIWFDCKEAGGYLGAYLHDGFDAPVLVRFAKELRSALPALLGPHPLAQLWAFKYQPGGTGTRPHADDATVNINLWLTPDDARTPGTSGGLRLYPVPVPADWGFDDYNRGPERLMALARAAARPPIDVPYRRNRAVIFDSRLIHETLPYDFRPSYADRRLNLTLLYGERPRSG